MKQLLSIARPIHFKARPLSRALSSNIPSKYTDPDPNTPISKVLDRLADVAFMTDLFRGVSA